MAALRRTFPCTWSSTGKIVREARALRGLPITRGEEVGEGRKQDHRAPRLRPFIENMGLESLKLKKARTPATIKGRKGEKKHHSRETEETRQRMRQPDLRPDGRFLEICSPSLTSLSRFTYKGRVSGRELREGGMFNKAVVRKTCLRGNRP